METNATETQDHTTVTKPPSKSYIAQKGNKTKQNYNRKKGDKEEREANKSSTTHKNEEQGSQGRSIPSKKTHVSSGHRNVNRNRTTRSHTKNGETSINPTSKSGNERNKQNLSSRGNKPHQRQYGGKQHEGNDDSSKKIVGKQHDGNSDSKITKNVENGETSINITCKSGKERNEQKTPQHGNKPHQRRQREDGKQKNDGSGDGNKKYGGKQHEGDANSKKTKNGGNADTNANPTSKGVKVRKGQKTPSHEKKHHERQQLEDGKQKNEGSGGGNKKGQKGNNEAKNNMYPNYWHNNKVLKRYHSKDPTLIRGTIRVSPGGRKDKLAFVTCDRGLHKLDVIVRNEVDRNRALDGDVVYVEIIPYEKDLDTKNPLSPHAKVETITDDLGDLGITSSPHSNNNNNDRPSPKNDACDSPKQPSISRWRDDNDLTRLWDPLVNTEKVDDVSLIRDNNEEESGKTGRVVFVEPPRVLRQSSSSSSRVAKTIVGTLRKGMLNGRINLIPNNRSLPVFLINGGSTPSLENDVNSDKLFCATYYYGSWLTKHRWPPCSNVRSLGDSYNPEDETMALLTEFDVNHGEFQPDVLRDVDNAVSSGMTMPEDLERQAVIDLQWRPTPEMYAGRRDFRSERIFTIDPTTAKDLDDALHVKPLSDGMVEIGVHIADVSHFVRPDSAVDEEAQFRATTVYLVDRTIPMLPRPLCEIACSLNENVERLAFSCVWTMNVDGTLGTGRDGKREVWFGKSVIKSCARLDYATAQNIIEDKVVNGDDNNVIDEELWPVSRRPTGGHTVNQVAADVRLMHRVAMARRKLRFQNGSLALNGIKLTFRLNEDGCTPDLCEPYPIKDSNRLVEEYMLLANYLVAERLLTHARSHAVIRCHAPPQPKGLTAVVTAMKNLGFDVNARNSHTLHDSLRRFDRECGDEHMHQCVVEMLTVPMNPAEYIVAGLVKESDWRHFALNIPYYTHFTSPIRRYADVLVHRLLQATLEDHGDENNAMDNFPLSQSHLNLSVKQCNEKRAAAKKAQERSDRVFLSLYLLKHPMESILGIVIGVGEETFNVFIPSLGISQKVFLEEQANFEGVVLSPKKHIRLNRRRKDGCNDNDGGNGWSYIDIKLFTKLYVSCYSKPKPPIDVSLKITRPF